jgi:cytochrome c-type biogenesis protein CcmF
VDAASIGTVALWGAVAASALTAIVAAIAPGTRALRILFLSAVGLAVLATATLLAALIAGDFAIGYVALTTSRATPWPYRVAALWGAMHGSLLFYSTLTLGIGAIASRRAPVDLAPITAAVTAAVGSALLLLTAVLASPFQTLAIPAVDGQGLLAILQHPAMVYHPPILYLGLTTLVAPFGLTIAAVAKGRLDHEWLRLTRRWLLVSWTLLAIGMVAGANWAYVELGWGGFWAWDPVENTALMPWLAITVFLHTSVIQERDGSLPRWNTAFALAPFVLTVLGVYLTRSGATGSIHSFAESETIGRILLIAAVLIALAAALAVIKTRGTERRGGPLRLLGRETWLMVNGALLAVALLVVVSGSAYPAYVDAFLHSEVAVPARFFVVSLVPIAAVMLVLMAFALSIRWTPRPVPWRTVALYAGATVIAGLVAWWLSDGAGVFGILILALAAAASVLLVVDLVRRRPRGRLLAGYLAHLGMTLVLLGGAASSLGSDVVGAVGPGDMIEVGPYTLVVDDIVTGEADRYLFVAAELSLRRGDTAVGRLVPEIRAYEQQDLPVPEPALRSTPAGDLVVAISRVTGDASLVWLSAFHRPLVLWVWLGALLTAAAGLVGLVGRGERDAPPRRAATEARRATGIPSRD